MSQARLVAIDCKISRGIVSDERAFEVPAMSGSSHLGVAPVYYFWRANGEPLGLNEPNGDQEIQGKIAARLLSRQNGISLVAIPDGSVISVDSKSVAERPSEVIINVSI
jgi:hypothetical protein